MTTELDENDGGYLIDKPDYVAALIQLAAVLAKFGAEDVYDLLEGGDAGVTLLHDLNVAIAVHQPKLHTKLQDLLAA